MFPYGESESSIIKFSGSTYTLWQFIVFTKLLSNYSDDFHILRVHLDIIKVFYSLTDAQVIVLKTVLKFTLK
jgi:hypothetical protein